MKHRHKWIYFGKFHPKTGEYFTYPCIASQTKEVWALYRCNCGATKAVLLEEGQPDYFIELRKVYAGSVSELLFGQEEKELNLCLHVN